MFSVKNCFALRNHKFNVDKMSTCITCKNPTNKYKCPNCLEYYCSLPCFKEHKLHPCEKPSLPENDDDSEPTLVAFTTQDTVLPEKLELLRTSEGLRNLLYNPHLRNLLHEIDVAPNAWNAIRSAMQEPIFIEFADECLKVIEPLE